MRLSVVVPVFNEEQRVAECLRRLEAYLSHAKYDWEVIVSSDGSTDRTDAIVAERAVSEPRVKLLRSSPNRGKGSAARRGMLDARGERVVMTDVDLSAPVKECEKLLAALDAGADVAIGSRGVRSPGADVRQSPKRRFAGRVFNALVRCATGLPFKDTQCGFKAFTNAAAKSLFSEQKLDGFAFDVEILLLARQKGLAVKEVPVMWAEGKDSKVSLVKDSFTMLKDVLSLGGRR